VKRSVVAGEKFRDELTQVGQSTHHGISSQIADHVPDNQRLELLDAEKQVAPLN
jgi:hypothetical protein